MPTTTTTTEAAGGRARRGFLDRPATDLAAALLPLLVVATVTWGLLELPASYLLQTAGLYAALVVLMLRRLPPVLPGAGLGAANRVTLLRATLVLPVAPLVLHPASLDGGALWWTVAVSALAMILDGADGPVARRTGTDTPFGGRFDMELDAFLILALSLLVWRSGRVDAWVTLIGALRYVFVAAGRVRPALRAPLPPSFRRKTVCVVQGVVLLVCLGPVVPRALAALVAGAALGALVASFAVDVRWLLRHGAAGRA